MKNQSVIVVLVTGKIKRLNDHEMISIIPYNWRILPQKLLKNNLRGIMMTKSALLTRKNKESSMPLLMLPRSGKVRRLGYHEIINYHTVAECYSESYRETSNCPAFHFHDGPCCVLREYPNGINKRATEDGLITGYREAQT